MKDINRNTFSKHDLLKAVDKIFPLSAHYKRILTIHLNELKSCKKIVDLGCGTGILTLEYLKEGKEVTGIDLSSESLQVLRKKAEKLGYLEKLNLLETDISDLGIVDNESFDGASAMISSHLVEDYVKHIEECYRVLMPKSLFVITARCKGGDQEEIVKIVKQSLINAGKYEEYVNDFIVLRDNLLRTAKARSVSLFSTNEAINILEDAGFRNIREVSNQTNGVMYTLVCEKI